MARRLLPIILLTAMALVGIVGYSLLRAPGASSGPIAAVPLQVEAAPDDASTASVPTVFQIDPSRSEARFVVDEVLRGEPKTVIGKTNQVAGQVAADLTQPSAAQVGTILINARTLATDDDQRNGAIRRWILSTDEHEYIRFTPTAIVGAPASASLGQPASLQIVGQLTIRDVTRPATFDATVTPVSASELRGSVTSTIRRADWNLNIPDVPFVAGVGDTVRLELDFVAVTA
jgi:polyisoprenoid-binding protein YceI